MNRSTATAYWVVVTLVLMAGTQVIVAPMTTWHEGGSSLGVGQVGSTQPAQTSNQSATTTPDGYAYCFDPVVGIEYRCPPGDPAEVSSVSGNQTTDFFAGTGAIILVGIVIGAIGIAVAAGGLATSGAVRGAAPGISWGIVVVGAIIVAAGVLGSLFGILPPELGVLLTLWLAVGGLLLYMEGLDYFAGRSG